MKLAELAVTLESGQRQNVSPQKHQQPRRKSKVEGADKVEQIVALVRELYSDVILVKVFPLEEVDKYYFVGPLDKDSLQDDRTRLMLKYGSTPIVPWTVFGQLASIPREIEGTTPTAQSNPAGVLSQSFTLTSPVKTTQDTPNMQDIVESMLDSLTSLFAQGGLSVTARFPAISITPLAIYRE